MKKGRYEIVRQAEVTGVKMSPVMKIDRALHAEYLHEIAKQSYGTMRNKESGVAELDGLPAGIPQSNIDNAPHIPTTSLSIGYRIIPVRSGCEYDFLIRYHQSEGRGAGEKRRRGD